MLEAFRKARPARESAEELQTLIATARQEREAIAKAMGDLQKQGTRVTEAARSLQQVEERATQARAKLDDILERLGQADKKATSVEAVDAHVKELTEGLQHATREAEKLTAPDGELQKHRNALQS